MPERPAICDQDVRRRVTHDLSTTYLVEAGAGTGKTSVLVERYVAGVLDDERGAGDVRRVAAITFTEKAAGELRQRIRERFEQLAAAPGQALETQVVARALDQLDEAPITTIHSFAARLLREFPVQAGVDPAFEQLDGLASELDLARLWDAWVADLAGEGEAPSALRDCFARLLRLGVRLAAVRELAVGAAFAERYDLGPVEPPDAAPDLHAQLETLRGPCARVREHCTSCCTDESDAGFCSSMQLVEACEALLASPPEHLDLLAAALYGLPLKTGKTGPGGAKGNWVDGGKQELLQLYLPLRQAVEALRDQYAGYVTGLVLSAADAFARRAGELQLGLGRLDFTDLLGRLRDLLAGDLRARGALQRRFDYILVDEFQDTDPLQAEIALYLCEDSPRARHWSDVELRPGKLFVVGDPKQSIYRFRRADITLYDEVKALLRAQPEGSAAVVAISQNFRTTPPLVEWVNGVFADAFARDEEEGRQPGYQSVTAYRAPVDGPRVAALVGPEYDTAAGQTEAARRDEARAIAALLQRLHDGEQGRWRVCDRSGRDWPSETQRPVEWRDVAILVRATTHLDTYEHALREAGVPYRVEGGKTYFARREVADLLLCLRAVDDPSDGPAVYGALHSSVFGFSDDDLFLFWSDGGRFDPFATDGRQAGRPEVREALGVLRELHLIRGAVEPHELVSELVRRARAAEFLAATGPGAPQAIANLDKLVERARAFCEAGGGGLSAFLAWARDAGDAAGEQESPGADDDDAVRVLTIHKAKGLEFPVVVLAGGGLTSVRSGGEVRVDRRARRMAIKVKAELPGLGTQDLKPAAYVTLDEREKLMARSEDLRLLYVALTRARDLLVVSCFGRLTTAKNGQASVLLGPLHAALPAPASASTDRADGPLLCLAPAEPRQPNASTAPDIGALIAERRGWAADRAALLRDRSRAAPATSPSGLERVDDDVRAGGAGAPPGRARALALGSAVHAVMERCDLHDEASVTSLATSVAAELGWPDLAARCAELAGACWRSPAVREAASAARTFRELPIGFTLDGVLVTGSVDLLFETADGAWVVVDYKTDRGAAPTVLRERYEPQGAAYALAVEAATGGSVREVVFVAADAGCEVRVPVDDGLRGAARDAVARAAREGRALAPDELGDSAEPGP